MTVGDFWNRVVPPYTSFRDGPVVATFKSNEPTRTITNQYQQEQHDFAVTVGGSDYLLGVSSKKLRWMLKEHLPLVGKTLKITRSGHGFETQYTVEEVQHKKNWKKRLLARFWGVVAHTALPKLFSWMLRLWVLRELLDWL